MASEARVRACMSRAIAASEEALQLGEVPIGCVIAYKSGCSPAVSDVRCPVVVDEDGEEVAVASIGSNRTNRDRNVRQIQDVVCPASKPVEQ